MQTGPSFIELIRQVEQGEFRSEASLSAADVRRYTTDQGEIVVDLDHLLSMFYAVLYRGLAGTDWLGYQHRRRSES